MTLCGGVDEKTGMPTPKIPVLALYSAIKDLILLLNK
jgi:hypothetical protein